MKSPFVAVGLFISFACLASLAWPLTASGQADEVPSTVTFDNRSGEQALVKLVGPTLQTVMVPKGVGRTVKVVAGDYYLLIRYGSDPKEFTYVKGDRFRVKHTDTEYSTTIITLYKVTGGNYPYRSIARLEFDNFTDRQILPVRQVVGEAWQR